MSPPRQVAVVGAGAVGTCCALALQSRGCVVTLIDRSAPGSETSHGNAGVLSRSMLLPFNNPGLLGRLPALLRNRSPGFRYSVPELVRRAGWSTSFLRASRGPKFEETLRCLDALIRSSFQEHEHWVREAGATRRVRRDGWLHLYRTQEALEGSAFGRSVYDRFGIATELLDRQALKSIEPDLEPVYDAALWIKDALTVDNPRALVEDYARLFIERGGSYVRQEIHGVERTSRRWRLRSSDNEGFDADAVVIATGPWSRSFLKPLGISIPLAHERGYHVHFAAHNGRRLQRPVLDGAGGFVLAPMEQGIRLTTGVELARQFAPPDLRQLDAAEKAARTAFPLAERIEANPWLGSRPTLPDSRPMIGPMPGREGLWFAFGHQHIGFHTSAGTGRLIADLVRGARPCIDAAPFSPARFL